MNPSGLVEAFLGVLLVGAVLFDVFESVVVPRPSPTRFRLSRFVVGVTWRLWRARGLRSTTPEGRERLLGGYGPTVILLLLLAWAVLLVTGYGLVFHGLREQLQPMPEDLAESIYFAGVALLTIGYGEIVPVAWPARIVALAAAGTGLAVVALTATYLFSLYGSFQRRETLVVTLGARAGTPPSGVALLETAAQEGTVDGLADLFAAWEIWSAEVLDSHVAYPILAYFRSSHDQTSWVSAVGAVLDAATLVLTTVEGVPRGPARFMQRVGDHLVEDVAGSLGLRADGAVGVERAEFDEARARLAAAGYRLAEADASWADFRATRASYASRINRLAAFWATPPAQWIGDRSVLRGHEREA